MKFSQTDQYDPNPWPQITTREWHLTAATPSKTGVCEFVALYRPHRTNRPVPAAASLKPIDGGYLLEADLSDGRVIALLPTDDSAALSAEGLATTGKILVQRRAADGSIVETIEGDE